MANDLSSSNDAQQFVDAAAVAARSAEIAAADWTGGCNPAGSCAPGVGIGNGGGIQTVNLGESLPSWTLLDQDGDARTPQVSQYIGGSGLGDGVAGKGTAAITLYDDDVPQALTGAATLAALAAGWTAV
jgi:hypothetical protein